MEELRNTHDNEVCFTSLPAAFDYYYTDVPEGEDGHEFMQELYEAETLREFAHVLNKYSDLYCDGSRWYIFTY